LQPDPGNNLFQTPYQQMDVAIMFYSRSIVVKNVLIL